MQADSRASRAEALRRLLLSLAQDKSISDEVLAEALALIKKPIGQFNIADYKLGQLLDELNAGNIQADGFMLVWQTIRLTTCEKETTSIATTPAQPVVASLVNVLIAFVLFVALAAAVFFGWWQYHIWQIDQREIAADRIPMNAGPRSNSPNSDYIKGYVIQGISLAGMAKTAVAEYYASMGAYPDSNGQIGLPAPTDMRGDGVSSVTVGKGGMITVAFNHLVGDKQTLIITPTGSPAGMIVWDCKGGTLPAQYRPPHCR